LLDSVDPKSDGADRSYIDVFDESEKLLYEEIDYLNEAKNADRFREQFKDDPQVRVPEMIYEFSTPKVLTMEFIESFKLTDIARVEKEGLDRKDLAKRVADTFLYQIVDTAYFHCDPHPGNLAVDTSGNLVYYDFGMMDELSPNVKAGFKEFCFALFEGGPMIDDIQLGVKAKQLVDAVETAGVLAKGADRLSSEQLARYFIRAFKDKQLGKDRSDGPGIKSTLGTELQSLTESQVFRFPSTFTFIFRAIASIDGIGKGLDEDYDLGEFAQPFVTKLIDKVKYGGDNSKKSLAVFGKATGLNAEDVNTALTQPRKIAYLEETMRSIEQGQLKIRVRSLENEMALTRLGTQSSGMTNLLLSSLVLNVASVAKLARIPQLGLFGVAGLLGFSGLSSLLKLSALDKKAAKYTSKEFNS
jgi:predicted unusual protein kinase regulating ubiquinone biosynthesis (AarF/ABC1/UbiB family)